jgi:branched-subunit amino acid ABC-type transport system permease component
VLQLVLNGVASGSIYGLVAMGFALIYQTTHFFHFSHAAVFTIGAYTLFLGYKGLHLPLEVAVAGSVAVCAVVGAVFELVVYRPMRKQGAGALPLLIVSIGLYIVVRNVIALVAGDDTLSVRSGISHEGMPLGDARITLVQMIAILVNLATYLILFAVVTRTNLGKKLRCISTDPLLALVVGIRGESIMLLTFVVGSILAGTAGMLFAIDVDMNPGMGLQVFMLALAAGIIGGMNTVHGPLLGGILVGLLQNLSVMRISSQWQDAIVFAALILFLLARPSGLTGKPPAKASL